MKSFLLTSISLFLTGPALALSCVKPDVAEAFARASESEKNYVVLLGQFAFTPPQKTDGESITLDSQFEGKLLTNTGFSEDIVVPSGIALNCSGPWCPEISPATDYIAFVEQSDAKLTFVVGPCYGFAFEEPTDDTIARLEQCAAGGNCDILAN